MDGYRQRHAYIATQGPLPATIGDFWRMIWEQQASTIVMMTKLEERSRLKCDQYWPSKGAQIYDGLIQVTLVDTTELSAYTIRTFVIAPVNTYAQLQLASNQVCSCFCELFSCVIVFFCKFAKNLKTHIAIETL